jgi:hypothetical protein
MGLFLQGKGGLRPLPTTTEHDRLSGVDAGFWGACVCLARLAFDRKRIRRGVIEPESGGQPWEGLAFGVVRALPCARSFSSSSGIRYRFER